MSEFSFGALSAPLRDALDGVGYTTPTPIQAEAIPHLLAQRDVFGCAQTGTGKTAAFVLPILERLLSTDDRRADKRPRALILTPTRELALQIDETIGQLAARTDIRSVVVMGGVAAGPQMRALRRGPAIVVATPGRLLDLHRQGAVDFSAVAFFVLDEADRMLDMGFIHDIRRVIAHLPDRRQNLLFSATMPKEIIALAEDFMHRPVQVEISRSSTTVERIDQAVCFVEKNDKKDALVHALERDDVERAIVFTRTKHGANKLVRMLENTNIQAAAIHGNKSQSARQRALDDFKNGRLRVLVATDVASRGIDIDDVTHVYLYDLPDEPEVYVHRVGRTGRAGRTGVALSFCAEDERLKLDAILRVTQEPLLVVDQEGHEVETLPVPSKKGGGRRTPSTQRRGEGAKARGTGRRRNRQGNPSTSSSAPAAPKDDARPPEKKRRRRKAAQATPPRSEAQGAPRSDTARRPSPGDTPAAKPGATPPSTRFRRPHKETKS